MKGRPQQPRSAARKAGGVFRSIPRLTNKNTLQTASIGISENFAIEAGRKLG
jgi:hypothetical protein